ncbi:MAG: nucleotidyltransferase domain-containing protein [Verrucomicrobia bacterium]|nr:nucleotidyltransferase domain-containing protein [Verrucomicrobiota bacterium]
MNSLTDLFPKARAEILRLLFDDPSKELHLRDVARLAGLTPAALQREVRALSSQEFLSARRDGNRVYYRANTTHPLYPELHGLVLKTVGLAAVLQGALAPVAGIDLALIFGSTASGRAVSGSDVDLLVLGTAGLRRIATPLRGVAQSLGREINPICFTPTEWRDKSRQGDALVTRILAEPKLWLKGGPDALAAMGG